MTEVFKMDKAQPRLLDQTAQGVIHQPLDRPEGPLKVTGQAGYAADHTAERLATGVLVRATIAKGRVKGMNDAAIRAMPGVLGLWTGARLLRNPAQGTAGKAPVQGADEVAYLGQPIALVVAETFEQARDAAQCVMVSYDETAAEVDPGTARSVETPKKKQLDQGDLDAAVAAAAAVVDEIYTTPPQNSAAMEPHASVAAWEGDSLTLHGSYQMLKYNRKELADALGITAENVRILAPFVGGGFGGKLGIGPEAVVAALAARDLARPVRVVLSRQQVFEATMRRSETRQRLRLAAGADGVLTGIGHEYRVSNLPDEAFSEPVAVATHFLYRGANRRIVHEVARVNRTCAGSVRAPGEAVGMLALESAMDELAHKLRLDPVEFRLRNIPDVHPETGKPFTTHGLAACLTTGAQMFGWDARNPDPCLHRDGEWWIGMGVAAAARTNILGESQARITLNPDGTALVETDMTDIGTGTYAVLSQIAAELLGLPVTQVTTVLGDTALPPSAGSGGSWGASSAGSAVLLAASAIRLQLAARLGCPPDALSLKDGMATGGNLRRKLTDLLDGQPITETGHVKPGATAKAAEHAGFGAHFASVAVNAHTGEVQVRRMLGVFTAGRILNAKTARSQCLGGMVWGIGAALTEEMAHDPRDGHIVNRDLADYHIPCNADVCEMEVAFVEERDDLANPLQSKGIGELSVAGCGAAITNAIFNACGVRVRDYPATLDKIFPYLPPA